jgi:hypothetical protein
MATINYEAGEEVMSDRTPIPVGKYEAMAIESEIKPTTAGDLNRLSITWQITSGDYEGRRVFSGINMPHENHPYQNLPDGKKKAIEIGTKELNTICRAVGKLRVEDSSELHNIPCIIGVKITPGKGDYGPKNEINNYESISGAIQASAPVSSVAPVRPAMVPPKAPAKASPPWAKK